MPQIGLKGKWLEALGSGDVVVKIRRLDELLAEQRAVLESSKPQLLKVPVARPLDCSNLTVRYRTYFMFTLLLHREISEIENCEKFSTLRQNGRNVNYAAQKMPLIVAIVALLRKLQNMLHNILFRSVVRNKTTY